MAAGEADSIDDFGPARTAVGGLGETAAIDVGARGDTVVVWVTDLGRGTPPLSLAIAEVTIE